MNFLDKIAYKAGYISETEAVNRSLPPALLDRINKEASDLELMADPSKAYKTHAALLQEIIKYLPQQNGINGYEQAGSFLKRKFPNPFALQTFILEGHWAAAKARRHNRVEFERDGWVLMADSRVGKKQVKKVMEELEDLGITSRWNRPSKRGDMFDHIKSFSNLFVSNPEHFNSKDGIEILLPWRIYPRYSDANPDELIGWYYQWNGQNRELPLNAVDHVRSYSLSKEHFGTPMLSSVVVDIEADLMSGVYNSTMWQKGGLIKAIVSMENPLETTGINQNAVLSFAQQMQELFIRTAAGVKGSNSLMFTPPVKGVHNLTNPKDLEGSYQITGERCAIRVCELLGCPPEAIGLSRSSQYVNAAATLDFATLSVDNDNYFVSSMVDQYINERIIQDVLGREGIYLQQKGEFGATSKVCAEFGAAIAQMGCDIMTVNEFRVKVLHWAPNPDKSVGGSYVGHYINEANMLKATKPAASAKDIELMFEQALGPRYQDDNQARFVAYDPRELKYLID